jgi:ribosomal protein L21
LDIDGFQCKINEGCRIILDNRPKMNVGEEVVFDKVMLVGAKDFTVLGRPYITSVSVRAVV